MLEHSQVWIIVGVDVSLLLIIGWCVTKEVFIVLYSTWALLHGVQQRNFLTLIDLLWTSLFIYACASIWVERPLVILIIIRFRKFSDLVLILHGLWSGLLFQAQAFILLFLSKSANIWTLLLNTIIKLSGRETAASKSSSKPTNTILRILI